MADASGQHAIGHRPDWLEQRRLTSIPRADRCADRPSRPKLSVSASALLALLFAAATFGASAAQAAPGAIPAGTPRACIGFDVYHASSATRALCHDRTIPLSAVTRRRDGGHEYRYGTGTNPITYVVPPAGFNAVAASESERKAYGIPAQPAVTEKAAHARWEQEIHNFHPSAPPKAFYALVSPARWASESAFSSELTSPGPALGDRAVSVPTEETKSGENWSGYVDTGEGIGGYKAPPFNQAGIIYREPGRLDRCEHSTATPWVGLGGTGPAAEPLDQAGTFLGKGFLGITEHQAWFENYEVPVEKRDEVIPVEFYSTPGANFQVSVEHGSGRTYFVTYYNFATGKQYGPIKEESREPYDGISAEYIIEAQPGSGLPFADFGTWEVAEAWAQGNHSAGPWDFAHEKLNASEGSRQLDSTSGLSGPESGREFDVKWEAFSESNSCVPEEEKESTSSPGVTKHSASEVMGSQATVAGEVNPQGPEGIEYYFEYRRSSESGWSAPLQQALLPAGHNWTHVSTLITGLAPETAYVYRLCAADNIGKTCEEGTFTTPYLDLGLVASEKTTGKEVSVEWWAPSGGQYVLHADYSLTGELNPETYNTLWQFIGSGDNAPEVGLLGVNKTTEEEVSTRPWVLFGSKYVRTGTNRKVPAERPEPAKYNYDWQQFGSYNGVPEVGLVASNKKTGEEVSVPWWAVNSEGKYVRQAGYPVVAERPEPEKYNYSWQIIGSYYGAPELGLVASNKKTGEEVSVQWWTLNGEGKYVRQAGYEVVAERPNVEKYNYSWQLIGSYNGAPELWLVSYNKLTEEEVSVQWWALSSGHYVRQADTPAVIERPAPEKYNYTWQLF
jgi:hypothetical protein